MDTERKAAVALLRSYAREALKLGDFTKASSWPRGFGQDTAPWDFSRAVLAAAQSIRTKITKPEAEALIGLKIKRMRLVRNRISLTTAEGEDDVVIALLIIAMYMAAPDAVRVADGGYGDEE